jgi:signal peptidase II
MNNLIKTKRYWIAIAAVIAIFFFLDRWLKNLALGLESGEKISIIKNVLNFHLVPNPYIAFSLPLSGQLLNIIISLLLLGITAYLLIYWRQEKTSPLAYSGWLMILGGGLSNLCDRWRFSYVIDYFDLYYFSIFNLADTLIFCGCLLVIINYWRQEK